MEETMKPADARPPLRVRALQTIAALLMIAVAIDPRLSISFSYLSQQQSYEIFKFLPLIYAGFSIFAMLLLFAAASDKSTRVGIGGLIIVFFIESLVEFLSSHIVTTLLFFLLQIYFWSVLLRNSKMSIHNRVWIVVYLSIMIYIFVYNIMLLKYIKSSESGAFEIYSYYLNNPGPMWNSGVVTAFIVVGLWKFCHSELFTGSLSPEPVQKELLSPLNRYMAAAVIVPVAAIACYYFCTSCLPDLFGMNWMQNF